MEYYESTYKYYYYLVGNKLTRTMATTGGPAL